MKKLSILLFLIGQIILASKYLAASPDLVQENEIELRLEDKKINLDEELLDENTSSEEFTPASAPQTFVEPIEVTNTFVPIPLDDQTPETNTPDPIVENETTELETLPLTYPLGEPLRVATPGIPFYGVEVDESFVFILPGDWWVDCYGSPRDHGKHQGWDYVMDSMDTWEVYTLISGVVTFSDFIYPYGNLVVIENKGFQLLLAHNDINLVAVGDIVQAGDLVSMAGDTGKSFGPHVHLEIRQGDPVTGNTGVVNPEKVNLPGQEEAFSWDMGISQTIDRFGRTYTCGAGIN